MRAFLALQLSPEVRNQLFCCQKELKRAPADIRWVGKNNFHITLFFLGEISRRRAEEIAVKMREALTSTSKFLVVISGMGVFPNPKRPRVVWAGVEKGREDVEIIYKIVSSFLKPLGFDTSGRYTPHVTLGRVKEVENPALLLETMSKLNLFCEDMIEGVSLMESILDPTGARYSVVAAVEFNH